MSDGGLQPKEVTDPEFLEDVRRLYTWASLSDMRYVDFSGERRRLRAAVASEAPYMASRNTHYGSAALDDTPGVKELTQDGFVTYVAELPDQYPTSRDKDSFAENLSAHQVGQALLPKIPGDLNDPYEQIVPADAPERSVSTPYVNSGAALFLTEPDVPFRRESMSGLEQNAPSAQVRTVVPEQVQASLSVPVVALFSLARGTGKTSLVATLGRAFSSLGEEVQLLEAGDDGLLPFYFGATAVRRGVVRSFAPPPGSTHAPIHLLSLNSGDAGVPKELMDVVVAPETGVTRRLLDLDGQMGWVLRKLAQIAPAAHALTIVVPVAPDLSSVLRLHAMERYLHGLAAQDGGRILPFYVLNKFDERSALHRELREALAGLSSGRLLPLSIRLDGAVEQAFRHKMTTIDYPQGREVGQDYLDLATYLLKGVPETARAGAQP